MENRKIMVNIRNVVTRLPELRFEEPLNWIIEEWQQWAVIGPNGAGKTLIADVMQRKFALKEGEVTFGYEGNVSTLVKSIAFKDIYSLADCRNSYYQQRWHSTETDEVPTIEDILKEEDIYNGSEFTGYNKKVVIKDYVLVVNDTTKKSNIVKEITVNISYKVGNKEKNVKISTYVAKE